ncbi:DNA mismatch repair protein MutS [Candidatus Woesearchaeota archaeon]|nr:DNA mismatch repair protein MutS [Candidatus Woesearchaeota archaeon]
MTDKSILELHTDDLTPGMKQYQEVKKAHPDCLVMLRMGDFYEMFYEDAITAARELEITLTSRGKGDKRAPLAGVPFHALETYLGRLVKKGYKVAIVEQLEDPKTAKGLVKRGLVRIVTPGTVIEASMLNEKENNFIAALTCHDETIAIAFCDLSTGEFFTKTILGIPTLLAELHRYRPAECIVPQSLLVNTGLIENIKAADCFINKADDYYFRAEKASAIILDHFRINNLSAFGLEDQKLNCAACGALLSYLRETQKNALTHIKSISVQANAVKMLLDKSTIRNLELLRNIADGSTRGTLLGILDKTVTAMGSRLLRRWILEPLLQIDLINQRLDALQELNKEIINREEIIQQLKDVQDLERVISRVNYGNATPRDLLSLKQSLEKIPELKQKISSAQAALLHKISSIDNCEDITKLIYNSIREDAPITVREGNIIKPASNPELKELQAIKTNSKQFLQQLEEQEQHKTGINSLKIGFNNVFGYYIEVTKKNLHLVPLHYIRKQTTANGERYITPELKAEEEKILGAEEKIVELEYALFQQILQQVASRTESIQTAAQHLALLDVLCCLAKIAHEHQYCRPQFVKQNIIQLGKSRHPVVEQLESQFIPNDILLGSGEMMLITGPNMAGKSTLMRQVALTVLLAQIGSFVPAEEAILGITNRIFTRVGAYDDLSSGQSTFMVEMTETANIMHNATENSLIILDEIGRGTSTFDGVSIAWSVAEYIYNNIRARTFFSTHYHVLNKLAEKCPRIKNYNLAVRESQGEIVFLRKLVEGGTDQSYGIHVAKLAGLPVDIVQRAQEIQEILQKDDEMVRKLKVKRLEWQKGLGEF